MELRFVPRCNFIATKRPIPAFAEIIKRLCGKTVADFLKLRQRKCSKRIMRDPAVNAMAFRKALLVAVKTGKTGRKHSAQKSSCLSEGL